MADVHATLTRNPSDFVHERLCDGFQLTREQLDDVHLKGAQKRFSELRPHILVLDKLASEQGIDEIRTIDDLAPLLFAHTVYKSYPMAHLERGRFDKLTRWLDGLTSTDLSNVNAEGVELIDDWLDLLDRETPVRVMHTSGTTGKLSFVPRTEKEFEYSVKLMANVVRDMKGPDSGPNMLREHRPLICPGYRYGASATQRGNRLQADLYAGGDDNTLFMYPNSRMSADLASLAGRLRVAEARGELGQLQLSPALLKRRDEMKLLEQDRANDLKRFFELAREKFGGKDICLFAVWPILFECAEEALARDVRNLFGPGSVLISGGGMKGRKMPDDWRQQIESFLGFDNAYEMYGTSEWTLCAWRCERGNYHLPPTLVPFMLNPETGATLPRKDGVKGRFAALDLVAETYWAGLVTGDEVQMGGWEEPCGCGRLAPYVMPTIRRYGENEGGDDRVVCSGAPEAHDRAAEFLANLYE